MIKPVRSNSRPHLNEIHKGNLLKWATVCKKTEFTTINFPDVCSVWLDFWVGWLLVEIFLPGWNINKKERRSELINQMTRKKKKTEKPFAKFMCSKWMKESKNDCWNKERNKERNLTFRSTQHFLPLKMIKNYYICLEKKTTL